MTETQLNGLALMYTHKDLARDAATVVEEYAPRHLMHQQLINPFLIRAKGEGGCRGGFSRLINLCNTE